MEKEKCKSHQFSKEIKISICKKKLALECFRELPTASKKTRLTQTSQKPILLLKKPTAISFNCFVKLNEQTIKVQQVA